MAGLVPLSSICRLPTADRRLLHRHPAPEREVPGDIPGGWLRGRVIPGDIPVLCAVDHDAVVARLALPGAEMVCVALSVKYSRLIASAGE